MPINDNKAVITLDVSAGSTINGQTFATNGTYIMMPTYTHTTSPTYDRVSLSWGDTPIANKSKETSLNADKILESLFRLNPAAREKYEDDKAKFAAALIAAGDAAEGARALTDLNTLGFGK